MSLTRLATQNKFLLRHTQRPRANGANTTNTEAVQTRLPTNVPMPAPHKKRKKCRKKHKHKHRKTHVKVQEPINNALLFESIIKDAMWWNWKRALPSGYRILSAELNFNLKGGAEVRVIDKTNCLPTNLTIPKLKRIRPKIVQKPIEVCKETNSPLKDDSSKQDASANVPLPIRDALLDSLPTSEDIWLSHIASKRGEARVWPLCCPQIATSSCKKPNPPPQNPSASQPKQICNEEQLKRAVESLIEWQKKQSALKKEEPHPVDKDVSQNVSFLQLESLELSLDEERSLLDYLKSKRLQAPLGDIKTFEKLQGLARNEKTQGYLYALLRLSLQPYLLSRKCPQEFIKQEAPQDIPEPVFETDETVTYLEQPLYDTNSEEIQIETYLIVDSLPGTDQETQQITEAGQIVVQQQSEAIEIGGMDNHEVVIIDVTDLPNTGPIPKPHEDVALQQWLQKVGQHLSLVVQSRIESLPEDATDEPITEPETEQIDFEMQISESANAQPILVQDQDTDGISNTLTLNEWETTYKHRLNNYEAIIDTNMTEFRDPHGKRLRSRWINESGTGKNLEIFRRFLLMPALPTNLDQGLQQLRILRPPTKRKIERDNLQIEMKFVRTYCAMQLNCRLDLHKLALELENSVYNSDIQVLQKRYESTQVAWIWENGGILISNARSKSMLFETQTTLLSTVLGISRISDMSEYNVVQSQTICLTQFPWHICIDEFSQTYSLSNETVHGNFRFAYYVNKNLPSVAAKVYESGVVHVFSMNMTQSDNMLEKLYLLTANHRKAKTSKVKADPSGTFIPIYPAATVYNAAATSNSY